MKKKLIIIAILIMSVGFAIVSTNLIINGTSTIGKTTFDVYFSGAEVDGIDKTNELVKDKKNIEFTSKNLLFTNDTSELVYEVTNDSRNYDAKVNVSCTNPSSKITVEEIPASLTVHAKQIETGSIVVTLNEMAVDPEDVVITCTLNVKAEERTSLGEGETGAKSYALAGRFTDESGAGVGNAYLAVFSSELHVVRTDMYGSFYVPNLERGIHEIYFMNTIDPSEMTKSEILALEPKKIEIATNNKRDIVIGDRYKLTSTEIKVPVENKYKIKLNKDNGEEEQEYEVEQYTLYGNLPEPNKEGSNFIGWYKGNKLITREVLVMESTTHTLKAKYSNNRLVIFNTNGGVLAENKLSKQVVYNEIKYEKYGELPTPTREGYTFIGWYRDINDESTKVVSTDEYTKDSNEELYAKWEVNQYTYEIKLGNHIRKIKYSIDNGSTYKEITSKETIELDYGTEIRIYVSELDEGYEYSKNSASNYETRTVKTTNNTYEEAGTPISYTITYTLNGGSATNVESYTIETNTFTLTNPSKEGHTFAGWTGTNLSSASTSVSINKGSTGDRSYTANWTVNNYYLALTIGKGIQSISYSTNNGGSYTTVTSNQNIPVAYGSKVRCYATAANGYKYDTYNSTSKYWSGTMGTSGLSFNPTGTEANGILTLTMPTETGITRIYYSVNGGSSYSSVTTTTKITVAVGTSVRCYATTEGGYTTTYNSTSKYWSGTMSASGLSFSPTATVDCESVRFTCNSIASSSYSSCLSNCCTNSGKCDESCQSNCYYSTDYNYNYCLTSKGC